MKKWVFLLSAGATSLMLIFRNTTTLGLCTKRDYECITISDTLEISLYIFVFVLFFSLITYKAPERIFAAWWGFTKFALPIILILTVVINLKLHHSPGGWFNMDADLDRAVFLLMYILYVLGSLMQIARGYLRKELVGS